MQSPNSFDWPPESFSWKPPHSAAAIANFLSLNQNDSHGNTDGKMAAQIKEMVEQFQNELNEKNICLDERFSFSLLRDTDSYPMKIVGRESTQMLRPVIIDGCAVAYSYDQNFDFVFLVPSSDLPFRPKSKLPVQAVLEVGVHFLLQGHKVTIYLPEYYRKPWTETVNGEKEWKVDKPNEYRVLSELGLIDFIDADISPSIITIPDKLKTIVQELGGCFFSHVDIVEKYENMFPMKKVKVAHGVDGLIVLAARMKIYENPAARMLSTYFFGPGKDLNIVTQFSVCIGKDVDKYKKKFDRLQEVLLYFYTENKGEPPLETQLREQLFLGKQIQMVLRLASVINFKMGNLRSVQALLLLAQKNNICGQEIQRFVKNHKWKYI